MAGAWLLEPKASGGRGAAPRPPSVIRLSCICLLKLENTGYKNRSAVVGSKYIWENAGEKERSEVRTNFLREIDILYFYFILYIVI